MKKITLLFLLIFAIAKTYAQNYQISFAGTGASTTVDSVQVENLTQCTDTILGGSDILHLTATVVGINELNTSAENTLHIYPNPMTGNCSVDFEATAQSKTTIGLYDITGKRILQVQELLLKGYHTYSLSGINSGIYFIKVESDKFLYTAKIISSNATFGIVEIKHIGTTPGIDKQSTTSNLPTGQAGTGKMKSLKSDKSVIDMQYTTGDRLKLTGKSGVYRTVFMLVPTQTQTVTFNFVACTDADNNNYSVVQIGTQVWMAENLKTTKYRNGDPIPNVTDYTAWSNLISGAYCDYDNTPSNSTIYGKLYNWYTIVDSRNLCPTGWHVPTDAEWTSLVDSLGGESVAGRKLKEIDSAHWQSPNLATNESGFTALPGAMRSWNGTFDYIGVYGYWWSSSEYNTYDAWYRYMYYFSYDVFKNYNDKQNGLSVRCLRD
ncbi:MAG: FISUMP domain-containing protein [Bacteroidales bacterium]